MPHISQSKLVKPQRSLLLSGIATRLSFALILVGLVWCSFYSLF